jgi:CheY-like chemotaxis protein
VNEALKLLRPLLPSTIEIRDEIALSPDDGVVFADPTEIHQVVMNLCTNAAHAMRAKGGVLLVELSHVVVPAKNKRREARKYLSTGLSPKTSAPEPGHYVCLAVADTGHGIAPTDMERIFDPYFTTKKVGEGSGLGLSVVQGIVSASNGAITADSEPGKGTTFKVYLRCMENRPRELTETKVAFSTGAGRILFVDDEKVLTELGRELLESLGYKVIAKTSSIEALETFKRDPGGFDLVVTDMTMPVLRGAELASEIIKIRPDIPIILCTGYSDLIDEIQAKQMGIREFVMKPYVVGNFAETIRRALVSKAN